MAKRKVAKAQSRASTRVRRATSARSAGAGKRKAAARAKAARGTKTSRAKAGARRTSAAKARVSGKGRAAAPKVRAKSARAKSAPAKSRAKVGAARPAPKKPALKTKKAAKAAAPRKAVVVAPRPKPPILAAVPRETAKRKKAPDLDRERRRVQDDDVVSPTPPSSLGLDRSASAARSGRQELRDRYDQHTETGPALTAGDIDGDWESAYSVGDEAPGGDNTTPDQNVVDDIGEAVGVNYDDNEELEGAERIEERDRHRWEFDPASSVDFEER